MTKFQNKYRIEPNRWQFWDYSSPASYFITVCVKGRYKILGRIENSKMILSDSGKIVSEYFSRISTYHKRIILDEWVIMPNHFHCLITLGDYDFDNGVSDIGDDPNVGGIVEKIHEFSPINDNNVNVEKIREFSLRDDQRFANKYHKIEKPTESQIKQYRKLRRKMLIPKIMGKFEMQTSKQINILNNTIGNKIWQKDYNDHVIRNDIEFQRIKNYIKNNPSKWENDLLNKKP